MIRFFLNNLLRAPGYYRAEENRIYRDLPFGFLYCCQECESTLEAGRIAFQLNSLKQIDNP